ncbi:PREDICTED: aspartyl protease family protein 1 [Tarenaya hassleriana]|uniref:aspartyl protease family protein 1 n=1 Tax=Tarenaya hassleriana TaxID=28532 RepID=UPI00053C668C|nr:PREDICTED: aspartyl protease family protein 1 [Tarenaya hassleriana]
MGTTMPGCFFTSILFLIPISTLLSSGSCHGRIFSFEMHHRFSDTVKRWADSTGKLASFPPKGSFEYYDVLALRDRLIRGRRLSETDSSSSLTFSDGNSTFRISSLGFLHYTTVQLGTPGLKFMVALDTGSDLFWVPCDCGRCAPTEGAAYASEFELSIYNPKISSTSKKVTCNDSLCAQRNQCLGTFSTCPYMVSYVSAETSTSGILMEDVLHLATEDESPERVKAYVTFGCGQVQSGSFLDIAAPNGLFGLGMEKISVPSILSREGLIADSFSMCFGHDGVGRISFGDRGSSDQEETPLNVNPLHPNYNVTVARVRVGTSLIDAEFTALFDTGTSFTYLVDPMYTRVSASFHSQAQDKRHQPDSRIPFEYCYDMSSEANPSLVPSMSLTMKGGGHFSVNDPIIVISTEGELIYCLAVVKSSELNIIGQNFMTGYQVVFNREKLILGWKKFDCYDIEKTKKTKLSRANRTEVSPAMAAGVGTAPSPPQPSKTSHDASLSSSSDRRIVSKPLVSLQISVHVLLLLLVAICS